MLAKVKDKYLTTLRAMRADIENSRVSAGERLEKEWRSREEEWEARWVDRVRSWAGVG